MSKFEPIGLPSESIKKSVEVNNKLADSIRPILEQQERLKEIAQPLKRASGQYQGISAQLKVSYPMYESLDNLRKSFTETCTITPSITAGTITDSLKLMPSYMGMSISQRIEPANCTFASSIAVSIKNIIPNFSFMLLEAKRSSFLEWLKSFDFLPWTHILENLKLPDWKDNEAKLDEIYLRAMYDAKWFPYAGWMASRELFTEINSILNSSRGMSKRCKKRIDKAILSYYTKAEIKRIKKEWNSSNLEHHVKKALGQTLEAYLREEYALVIPFLATMWEGIIKSKTAENTKRPKEDFKNLVDENGFDDIFSDFYNELIIGTCYSKDDVIEGVPNRHGVAHSWYIKYPTKKAALNAILLTDFVVKLKPSDKNEIKKVNMRKHVLDKLKMQTANKAGGTVPERRDGDD